MPNFDRKGNEIGGTSYKTLYLIYLVDMLMNKDPSKISSALDFLVKMLEKYESKEEKEKTIYNRYY